MFIISQIDWTNEILDEFRIARAKDFCMMNIGEKRAVWRDHALMYMGA